MIGSDITPIRSNHEYRHSNNSQPVDLQLIFSAQPVQIHEIRGREIFYHRRPGWTRMKI
jgi:hypothetical protein